MFKLIKKYLMEGIGWGCFFLVINLIRTNLTSPELLPEIFENFIPNAIAQILIVMGLVSTMIIFEITRWHIGLKLIVHFILAVSILLIVGFSFNILSPQHLSIIPRVIFENSLVLLLIWIVYYFEEKRDIQKINKRLLEINLEQQSDIE